MISIDLSGETAIVTGAGQGLGQATAGALHSAGANVVINYFDDLEGMNRAKADQVTSELGSRAIAIEADIRDPAAVDTMFDRAIEAFGGVHIVVNNAGILRDRSLKNMELQDWTAVIDTNLTGVFNVCRTAAARLAHGGRIINLASISAVVGFYGQANYAAAKSGVIGLTKVLSRELAKSEIRVNALVPGVIMTEMGKSIPEEIRKDMLRQIPLQRFGEPEEIANAILFLASSLSSYISGQTIHVNGGWWG